MNKCPTCGVPVRIVRRPNGAADHYEPINPAIDEPPTLDRETELLLRDARSGKRTVAIVGMASTSCNFAPFGDMNVEIWAMNEMHHCKWLKRATRWFQIHHDKFWKREIDKRGNRGHKEWLESNPWDIPIYTMHHYPSIPKSVPYPIVQVCDTVFGNFRRGTKRSKYFTSTFAYMMGIAILEKFERIEIYGFEMSDDIEYVKQKACSEFWIGNALARNIEIYVPENCQILQSNLYGEYEQGDGW